MYSLLSSYFVIPEVVLPGSTIALYADDCKCSRIIDTVGDLDFFQQDRHNLHQWSVRNFMSFNVKKCKIMKMTEKTEPLISSFFCWIILDRKRSKSLKTWGFLLINTYHGTHTLIMLYPRPTECLA